MTTRLTLRRPDDMHLHLRDGAMLRAVLPETTRHFARAIIMPNLVPPVVTANDARAYRDRILAALPPGADFTPLMTLYLTEATDPTDVARAHADGIAMRSNSTPPGPPPIPTPACATSTASAPCWKRWPKSACPSASMAR